MEAAEEQRNQTAAANISRRIVGLHKEYYGRGPSKAKTWILDDLVVVLMRGGFSKAEETLLQAGRGDSVISQRLDFQDVMGDRFAEVIETETGRSVVGMINGSRQQPDLLGQMSCSPRRAAICSRTPTRATATSDSRGAGRRVRERRSAEERHGPLVPGVPDDQAGQARRPGAADGTPRRLRTQTRAAAGEAARASPAIKPGL